MCRICIKMYSPWCGYIEKKMRMEKHLSLFNKIKTRRENTAMRNVIFLSSQPNLLLWTFIKTRLRQLFDRRNLSAPTKELSSDFRQKGKVSKPLCNWVHKVDKHIHFYGHRSRLLYWKQFGRCLANKRMFLLADHTPFYSILRATSYNV